MVEEDGKGGEGKEKIKVGKKGMVGQGIGKKVCGG